MVGRGPLHLDLCPTSAQPQSWSLHRGRVCNQGGLPNPRGSASKSGLHPGGLPNPWGGLHLGGVGRPSPSPHVDRMTHRCKTLPCPKLGLGAVIIKTVDDKIYKLAVPKMVRLRQSTIHRVGVNLHVLLQMPRLPPSLKNISK